MAYYYDTQIGFGGKLTKMIKYLIIINASVFLLHLFGLTEQIFTYFALTPALCIEKGMLWQLLTYHFIHQNGLSLLINMFILWMFGSDVEEVLGSKYFLAYYLFCALGAGLGWLVLSNNSITPLYSASGVLFGVLFAFAYLFPERIITLLLLLVFPVRLKAKYLVAIFIGIELLMILDTPSAASKYSALYAFFAMSFGYLFLKNKVTAVKLTDKVFTILNYFKIFKFAPKKTKQSGQKYSSTINNVPYTKYTEAINKLKALRQLKKDQKIIKPNFKNNKNTFLTKGTTDMTIKEQKISKEVYISKEIDPILDKISKEGIHSLSNEEKAKLDAAKHLIK